MKLVHIALACSSEAHADEFYVGLLGLVRSGSKTVDAATMTKIFGVEHDCPIVNYVGEGLHCEVFITDRPSSAEPSIEHVCLEVGDLEGFVGECKARDLYVLQIPREGGHPLTFVRDFDGNHFEIKQRPQGRSWERRCQKEN